MGFIQNMKESKEHQKMIKQRMKDCKAGIHTAGMMSWEDKGYTYSKCVYCDAEIYKDRDNIWKKVSK